MTSNNATIPKADPEKNINLDPSYIKFHNENLAGKPTFQSSDIDTVRQTLLRSLTVDPVEMASVQDMNIEHNHATVPVTAYTPKGSKPANGWPVVLYFHGGGFVGGSHKDSGELTYYASKAQCVVVSVGYRLAPEHVFPAAVDDACHAYKWLADNAENLEIDTSKIAIVGTSSGGGMAVVVSHFVDVFNNDHSNNEADHLPKPVEQILLVPALDARQKDGQDMLPNGTKFEDVLPVSSNTMNWFKKLYLPNGTNAGDPRASPLLYPDSTLPTQPKTLIIAAECDVLQPEAEQYACRLRDAGVDVEYVVFPGAPHVFTLHSRVIKGGVEAMDRVIQDLQEAFKDKEDDEE